jgi:hypothetical protein
VFNLKTLSFAALAFLGAAQNVDAQTVPIAAAQKKPIWQWPQPTQQVQRPDGKLTTLYSFKIMNMTDTLGGAGCLTYNLENATHEKWQLSVGYACNHNDNNDTLLTKSGYRTDAFRFEPILNEKYQVYCGVAFVLTNKQVASMDNPDNPHTMVAILGGGPAGTDLTPSISLAVQLKDIKNEKNLNIPNILKKVGFKHHANNIVELSEDPGQAGRNSGKPEFEKFVSLKALSY